MRAVWRRLHRLEEMLVPKIDLASQGVADLIRERRRRRLEESGQPFEDYVRDSASPAYVAPLSVAVTLRLCRRQRIKRYCAAPGEES
jgi:hypothetical protein